MGRLGLATGTLIILTSYLLICRQLITVEAATSSTDHSSNNNAEISSSRQQPARLVTTRFRPISNRLLGNQYVRIRPFNENIDFLIDDDDIFGDVSKRQFDDYGHMRFGKRTEQFDDYGHMRFGRSGASD